MRIVCADLPHGLRPEVNNITFAGMDAFVAGLLLDGLRVVLDRLWVWLGTSQSGARCVIDRAECKD